jgi:hypothetical protein
MRLDGPDGPDTYPGVHLDIADLCAAVEAAGRSVRLEVAPGGHEPVALVWGSQIDTRPISTGAGRDAADGDAHPEQVAAYLAKYLTKSTEDFGLDGHGKVHSAIDARYVGASAHAMRIIETAEQLAADAGEDYQRLADRYGTLGYRGHVLTKTRRYSTTFGALRQARQEHRRQQHRRPGLDADAAGRELDADADPDSDAAAIVVERNWRFVGSGYFDTETAARALTAATMAREHRAAHRRLDPTG